MTGSTDKPKKAAASARAAEAEGSFTSIAPGATLEGRLRGSGVVVVHGILRGRLELEGELLVPKGGLIDGQPVIRASRVRLEGESGGRIEATELLEVAPGSLLGGEARAPQGRIDPGARTRATVLLGPEPGSATALVDPAANAPETG
jgi:cytoskeletal protein CcmA (bactofilin family)